MEPVLQDPYLSKRRKRVYPQDCAGSMGTSRGKHYSWRLALALYRQCMFGTILTCTTPLPLPVGRGRGGGHVSFCKTLSLFARKQLCSLQKLSPSSFQLSCLKPELTVSQHCLHQQVCWGRSEKWRQQSLHQIPRWWHHFPLGSRWSSVLQLSSWNTGYLHSCRAPITEWETNGKNRHLQRLPVNPASLQLSWSRPDDQGPALLPYQAHSSVSLRWVPAYAGLTGNERTDRLAKLSSQAPQTQNPVTYREVQTLLHSRFSGVCKIKNPVDIGHTLTQFGDWNRPSRPLSSPYTQGTVVWALSISFWMIR